MPRGNKTLAELIQVLDDGTTLYDILYGFGWYKKELARSAEKNKKRSKKNKDKSPVENISEVLNNPAT